MFKKHVPLKFADHRNLRVFESNDYSFAKDETLAPIVFDEMAEALLRNSCLRHDGPFPRQHQATRTISAVPRAEKRFISAMRIWISVVWRSGSLAAMRSPKALRQRIFASIRLRTWYPVHRFQNARP